MLFGVTCHSELPSQFIKLRRYPIPVERFPFRLRLTELNTGAIRVLRELQKRKRKSGIIQQVADEVHGISYDVQRKPLLGRVARLIERQLHVARGFYLEEAGGTSVALGLSCLR